MVNVALLSDEMIDEILVAFQSIDSEWGPVTEGERGRWGDIMRALGRQGYKNWWYVHTNGPASTVQEWY